MNNALAANPRHSADLAGSRIQIAHTTDLADQDVAAVSNHVNYARETVLIVESKKELVNLWMNPQTVPSLHSVEAEGRMLHRCKATASKLCWQKQASEVKVQFYAAQ